MSTAAAYATLRRLAGVITTREAAAALRTSSSAASRTLRTLERQGLVRRIRHGAWTTAPELGDPRRIVPDLARPYPGYVSFDSALAARGVIDQIPREIAVASMAKSRRINTALGVFVIHHLPPELYGGYVDWNGIPMATIEKALFDECYVAAASGHPRRRLPELDLPSGFSPRQLHSWIARVRSPRLRTLIARAVERALTRAEHEDTAVSTRHAHLTTTRASHR